MSLDHTHARLSAEKICETQWHPANAKFGQTPSTVHIYHQAGHRKLQMDARTLCIQQHSTQYRFHL
jgi:hypothetical protein